MVYLSFAFSFYTRLVMNKRLRIDLSHVTFYSFMLLLSIVLE